MVIDVVSIYIGVGFGWDVCVFNTHSLAAAAAA